MRIRHKILLGYVALIAVVMVLVVFFLVTLSDVNRRYADMISRDGQILARANDLRSNVLRQIVVARTFEQIRDDSLKIEYFDAVRQQQKALDAINALLTDEADIEAIRSIEEASRTYTEMAQDAMSLATQPNVDQTVLTLKRVQGETARLDLVNAIERFIANRNMQVNERQATLTAKVEETSSQLLVWSLVSVIAAITAGTLLTEGFTSPLRRLMRNIQGISSGDLQTAVAVHSKDEIGELAAVLETMRQRLAAALAEKESLLDKAHEEAEKLARTQHELEVANNELQEALELESEARKRMEEIDRLKSEFASMVSHELKTPVSYVYNYAGALKEHNENLNESQRTEFLTAIQGEAQHLITLIDDIMAISLLETVGLKHHFVETDLRKLIDSVVKDQQLTTRRHTITIKGPDSLPVRADPTRLKQVLNNLVSNAIKYSPQGGPVEVRLWANTADNTALIYVRDHGIGVDPEDVPQLFDRFSRVQRKETMAIPGSGLGLYIAHHIVEAHGGVLKLEPAPGGGTIAEVTVPLIATTSKDGYDPDDVTQPMAAITNGGSTVNSTTEHKEHNRAIGDGNGNGVYVESETKEKELVG
jgi:signal transduction histidine kinase